MFPEWTINRIQKEVIDNLNLYWLQPQTSFEVKNEMGYQFDFSITTKAFQFWCFDSIQKAHLSNKGINKLFIFYVKNLKPQYESWSLGRIVALKLRKPIAVDGFTNVGLKVYRGHNQTLHELSLVDITFLNPYDWISLFVAKGVVKYEPILQFLRRMVRAYILEIAKMDIEISNVLIWNPILKPFSVPDEVDQV